MWVLLHLLRKAIRVGNRAISLLQQHTLEIVTDTCRLTPMRRRSTLKEPGRVCPSTSTPDTPRQSALPAKTQPLPSPPPTISPRHPRSPKHRQNLNNPYGVRQRKRNISRHVPWRLLWISCCGRPLTLPFALGGHVTGGKSCEEETPSFDFAVSGADNRVGDLMVVSKAAETSISTDGDGGGGEDKRRSSGLVVVGGSNQDSGVVDGDLIVAVGGVPLSAISLEEWIEFSTAIVAGSASPPASPSSERVAMFPLVDVDWGFQSDRDNIPTTENTTGGANPTPQASNPRNQCSGNPNDQTCLAHARAPSVQKIEQGVKKGEGFGGFPLSGFLKVELVGLAEAEITFRPGEIRRAVLVKEREEVAAAEKKERERVAAEAKASLEAARNKKDEENQKAEAAAKVMDAERARQQAEADKAAEEKRKEDDRVRREEEAAAKAAKKSKEDMARLRKEGKQFTFVAEYKEVAPMGLTFDLANPLAVVSDVVNGGLSHAAGVQVGDHLVHVNERDTSEMKPTMAIKLLQRAVWPRLLTFSTPERAEAEGGDEPLLLALVVAEPEIAQGEYLVQAPKEWGGLSNIDKTLSPGLWSCESRPMALADPLPACQRDLVLSAGGEMGEREGIIVLVKRGVCTFVEKAKNVQQAILNYSKPKTYKEPPRDTIAATGDTITITTAAAAVASAAATEDSDLHFFNSDNGDGGVFFRGGMVLLNGDDVLADMPAGNLVTDDVRIPVAMISQGNGSSVEALLSWGVEVRATIAPLGACPPHASTAQGVMPRKEDDDGGRFLVLSKDEGGAEFDYRQAQYGPGVVETSGGGPEGIAVAEPFDGCDDKAYKVRVAGMFVAVQRGGCSFSMKTLAAQRAGAFGVIIVNTAEATLRVMADAGEGDKARIPTVMISATAGRFLSRAAGSSRSPILGRFTRESVDAKRG